MAEEGTAATLAGEVNAGKPDALGAVTYDVPGIAGNRTETGVVFTSDHPRITLTSMIAPTPDWFVGVSGLSLLDSSGDWLSSRTVELYPWDAGTEDGTGFDMSNADTNPKAPIASLRGRGKFTGERIARLVFTRTGTVALAPAAPAGFQATAGDGAVTLGWTVPSASGITGHEYRQKTDGDYGDWTAIADSAPGGANEDGFAVAGLPNGTAHTFQLRAVNAVGGGVASAEMTVTPVAAANNPATGAPAVSGFAQVGKTLTAAIGNIADADGRPDTFPDDYTFQWIRVDADGTNPVNIGTDSGTYALVADDVGKKIKVEVSFQDDDGNDEEVTGEPYPSGTATVGVANNPATGAPAISGTARAGETLTAAKDTIADADGLPDTFPDDYTFQWVRVDADGTNPVNIGTDSGTYALVADDVGKKIKVEVSFQDDDGNDEEVTGEPYPSGTATVGVANNPATGAPAISGTARAGETLTAAKDTIADADGRPDTFPDDYSFQWVRVNADGTNPVNIGTDLYTYALVADDEGKKIKVEISFQDDDGNDEALTSAAYPLSGTVDPANNAPTFTEGASATRSVAENTAAGADIGDRVAAADTDTGDTLTYTLGGTDAAAFAMVSTSGQLRTKAALNFEAKSSYAVTVSVSDGNGGADSIAVTINVTDADEQPARPAAPDVSATAGNHHQPDGELDRAGAERRPGHRRLRPAIPPGRQR